MRSWLLALAMVAAFALQASATHIIDPFETGTFDGIAKSGTITDSQSGLTDVIGLGGDPPGQRDILCTITTPGLQYVEVRVGSGALNFSVPSGENAVLRISYGSYTSLGGLNADFTGDSTLNFAVSSADLNGQVDVTLSAGGDTYALTGIAIPGGTGTHFSIPYSSFPGLVASGNLRDVDGIQFAFSTSNDAWDIRIDSISSDTAVPEPATLSLFALGGLALLRRKSRRTHAH